MDGEEVDSERAAIGSLSAPSVCAIDSDSVHRICSGQVVVDLATAVKELVENSLDAGSTQVDVRLREHGSELIEVSDNGRGIAECDFEGIARKHCTSKLREFADLADVATFGFRGEALSSLCALAEVSIVTRQDGDASATRLTYDNRGEISSRSACARERGTTVSVQRLFHALPVRFKQLRKNLKREYARLVQVLQAYCMVSKGVRISCFNQTGDRPRQTVLATAGVGELRDNVLGVFGPKQLNSLVDVVQCSCAEAQQYMCDNGWTVAEESTLQTFKLSGLVSQIAHGSGRSAPDRQFFFANGRPWTASRLAKAVNELYHSFNRHQYPFLVLLVEISERSSVDVNVTPDKRSILVEHEKALIAVVLCSLAKAFGQQEGVFSVKTAESEQNFSPGDGKVGSIEEKPRSSSSQSVWTVESLKRRFAEAKDERPKKVTKQLQLLQFGMKAKQIEPVVGVSFTCSAKNGNLIQASKTFFNAKPSITSTVLSGVNQTHAEPTGVKTDGLSCIEREHSSQDDCVKEVSCSSAEHCYSEPTAPPDELVSASCGNASPKYVAVSSSMERVDSNSTFTSHGSLCSESEFVVEDDLDEQVSQTSAGLREVSVASPFDLIAERFWLSRGKGSDGYGQDGYNSKAYFKVRIAADTNSAAERELERHISRSSFADMAVVGQFNLGFIIAKLRSDLFIVDQHASDEKFNFERLQRDVRLQHQPLVVPQLLALPPDSEQIIMDNMDVFERNGFKLDVQHEAQPTHRLSLLGLPTSKNWMFGKPDIEEMVFMIQEDMPLATLRPSRVRAMFASRACRSSVMIGTALNLMEMHRILQHMGEMDQPWNCPHGRPTMRHLLDLSQLPSADQSS